MDIREQLLAYLEGTLSQEQRLVVARRLAESSHWQRELAELEYVQNQLKREMPLFGQPQKPQLNALLPDILEKSQRQPLRLDWLQLSIAVCSVSLLLVMIPLFMHAQNAVYASINANQNVPRITATPTDINGESTSEPAAVAVNGRVFTVRYVANAYASPAPAPGATLEASLEAVYTGQ